MTMHLILPKATLALEKHRELPLFFLAGPALDSNDWRLPLSRLLVSRFKNLIIVNPGCYKLSRSSSSIDYAMYHVGDKLEDQVDWEQYYMGQAAEKWERGCLIFWLASQKGSRQNDESYVQETNNQITKWRARLMDEPNLRIVIGAEKDFSGLAQIKYNFELTLPDLTICHTMEEVVEEVVSFNHFSVFA